MGKSKKHNRHFMDDTMQAYKKIRKPIPKPSRAINDKGSKNKDVSNWRFYIDGLDDDV